MLLDSNGQWRVLSAEQEQGQEQSLTGSWRGILADGYTYQAAIDTSNNKVAAIISEVGPYPQPPVVTALQIVQNNQLITGIYCLDECSEKSKKGLVTGTIVGNKVMMKFEGGYYSQNFVIEGEFIVISGKSYIVAFSEEKFYIDPTKGPLGNLKWAYAFTGL